MRVLTTGLSHVVPVELRLFGNLVRSNPRILSMTTVAVIVCHTYTWDLKHARKFSNTIWASSWDNGTYHIGSKGRLKRGSCVYGGRKVLPQSHELGYLWLYFAIYSVHQFLMFSLNCKGFEQSMFWRKRQGGNLSLPIKLNEMEHTFGKLFFFAILAIFGIDFDSQIK